MAHKGYITSARTAVVCGFKATGSPPPLPLCTPCRCAPHSPMAHSPLAVLHAPHPLCHPLPCAPDYTSHPPWPPVLHGGALRAVCAPCARSATIWGCGRSRNTGFVILWALLLFDSRFCCFFYIGDIHPVSPISTSFHIFCVLFHHIHPFYRLTSPHHGGHEKAGVM